MNMTNVANDFVSKCPDTRLYVFGKFAYNYLNL